MVKKNKENKQNLVIYQGKNGEIRFQGDFRNETIWASQKQIAEVFGIDRTVVTKHINNILKNKEVDKKSNVQKMHIANSDKPVIFYSLDIILAVGYRTNSAKAIDFRIWATKTLKQYLTEGFVINKNRINENYQKFVKAISDVKAVLPSNDVFETKDVLELVNAFAGTWFSLDAYDKETFSKKGTTKKQIKFTVEELSKSLLEFKQELISKKQTTEIFGQERNRNSVEGIVGNVFQSFSGKNVYPTIEEKASHLLYFIVKNHPFVDGNKRSGAFAFVWFLRKSGILRASLTPEALTALTLLVAESNSKDKDKITNLVVFLLRK
ncbi:MAG: virulence protein RhuM/Fic/DOC family protein [Patescibacteria group bacterium]